MNADRIINALRVTTEIIDNPDDNVVLKIIKGHMATAANLIESLQAQLKQVTEGRDYAEELLDKQVARNEGLKKRLSESKRREQAAVEDLKFSAAELSEGLGTCVVCRHYPDYLAENYKTCNECAAGKCLFDWRGPQKAGERP